MELNLFPYRRGEITSNDSRQFVINPREWWIPISIFVLLFTVFWLSPRRDLGDSHYTLLLSETLITQHTFQLDDAFQLPLDPEKNPGMTAVGLPYHMVRQNGHIYSIYPPGSAILAVPYMAVMRMQGRTLRTAEGGYNEHTERRLQIILATLLMAATGVLWYFTARRLLSPGWSAAMVFAFALGTSVWSLQSRALGAETWATLLLSLLVGRLVAAFVNERPLHPIWCATLVSWLFFIRPPYAAAALALIALLAFTRRWRDFAVCALAGAAWLAGFIAWSLAVFHQPLPHYFSLTSTLVPAQIPVGMAGLLVSPGRGLFLFSPFLLVVMAALFGQPYSQRLRPLCVAAFAGIVLHLTVFAAFPVWWGGHCFGSRYSAAVIPWFFLLALIALHAVCSENPRRPFSVAGGTALALLLAASVLIHGFGAISLKSTFWNLQPQNIDEAPARLWDWRQPQFLSGLLRAPLPDEFPAWPSGRTLALDQPGAIPQLWDGWSGVESGTRWAMAPSARVLFALDEIRPLHLRLELRPYLLPGKLEAQRLNARLNGQPVGTWRLTNAKQLTVVDIPLPPVAQRTRNVVEFEFPDARSPESLIHASDPRRLGAAMKSLTLLPGEAAESRGLPDHQ